MEEVQMVSWEDAANHALSEYFQALINEINLKARSEKNGSKKKAFNEVIQMVIIHKKRWDFKYKQQSKS